MAPNRRKKKPVSNPARGFATTSVASKIRTKEIEDTPITEETTATSSKPVLEGSQVIGEDVASNSQSDPEKKLHEMTPEELEAHLEESDLQVCLEIHGERVKREASRQVARLKTERRILRTQADTLRTTRWLPPELIVLMQDYIGEEGANVRERLTSPSNFDIPSNDLLVQVWKLYLILPGLGFSSIDTEDALTYMLRGGFGHKAEKNETWGLDQCLDFLALRTVGEGKSEYETPILASGKGDQNISDADLSGKPCQPRRLSSINDMAHLNS